MFNKKSIPIKQMILNKLIGKTLSFKSTCPSTSNSKICNSQDPPTIILPITHHLSPIFSEASPKKRPKHRSMMLRRRISRVSSKFSTFIISLGDERRSCRFWGVILLLFHPVLMRLDEFFSHPPKKIEKKGESNWEATSRNLAWFFLPKLLKIGTNYQRSPRMTQEEPLGFCLQGGVLRTTFLSLL